MIKKTIGENVRRLRTQKSLTQDQLSFEAGITLRFLQEIEAGKKGASLNTIFKLSKALETAPEKLIAPAWKAWLKNAKD